MNEIDRQYGCTLKYQEMRSFLERGRGSCVASQLDKRQQLCPIIERHVAIRSQHNVDSAVHTLQYRVALGAKGGCTRFLYPEALHSDQ